MTFAGQFTGDVSLLVDAYSLYGAAGGTYSLSADGWDDDNRTSSFYSGQVLVQNDSTSHGPIASSSSTSGKNKIPMCFISPLCGSMRSPLADVRDTAETDMAGGGVLGLRRASRRPVAVAVLRRAEMRAAFDHPSRDVLAGLAGVVAVVG